MSEQTLHPIERRILNALRNESKGLTFKEIKDKTLLHFDQIRRGIEWLTFKQLVTSSLDEYYHRIIKITDTGIQVLERI